MAYGAILGQTSQSEGKRVTRFTVGTSTSGWTTADCDYLCDGTSDNVEINAAIQALPADGGEIIILDGTYNIATAIAMNKQNVKLYGNGWSTILNRAGTPTSSNAGIINVTTSKCQVGNLTMIGGYSSTYSSNYNYGIYLPYSSISNTIIESIIFDNFYSGIYISSSSNNLITNNFFINNNQRGINLSNSDFNVITNNTFENNYYGMYSSGTSNDGNNISNNTFESNTGGLYLINANNSNVSNNIINGSSYGINLNRCNYTIVSNNICRNNSNSGIDINASSSLTVVGNVCDNNNYGININGSGKSTITGNSCNNNSVTGIYLSNCTKNVISGNTCIVASFTSSQYSIQLSGESNSYNLISNNNIYGKDYSTDGGTGNEFYNNKYN